MGPYPPSWANSFAKHLIKNYGRAQAQRATRSCLPLLSLDAWAAAYLGHYFPCANSSFHAWLAETLGCLHKTRGTRLNILAPRGAAKSTWSTLVYPLYCVLHGLEEYVVITSDTGQQAEKFLDAIRAELETNECLNQDYPHLAGQGPVWRNNRIRLKNGAVIEAIGTGTKLRGRRNRQHRPNLIIVDDPQNTGHIVSALQRDRSWEWLTKDVCNAGSPTTNIVLLGTALHREAIVCRCQVTPGWQSTVFRSLISWPDRMDLWREWQDILLDHDNEKKEKDARAFYESNRAEMDRGAVVLWPERESLYDLMLLLTAIGEGAFNTEKQNNPVDPTLVEWDPKHFDRADLWFDSWPDKLQVKVLSIDPSKGKDAKRGDYSAIVLYGRTSNAREWCEADLARRSVDAICRDAARLCARFNPDAIVLEGNAWQDLLAAPLRQALEEEGVARVEIRIVDNSAPKPVRIRRLTTPIVQRFLRFKSRSPGTALLLQQLRDFPHGSHDDGPDALEMARRIAIQLLQGGR